METKEIIGFIKKVGIKELSESERDNCEHFVSQIILFVLISVIKGEY